MLHILIQILPFFIIVGVGILITQLKIANASWLTPLGKFALNIGFPSLIFVGLTQQKFNNDLLFESFFSFGSILICIILSIVILSRIFPRQIGTSKSTYLLLFLFGNAAYLGIPLISSFGNHLQTPATIHAAVMLFIVFTIGLWLASKWKTKQTSVNKLLLNLLKNPLLISVIIGFTFNYFNLHTPSVLYQPISMFGNSVAPIVMLMIGIFIAVNPIKKSAIKSALLYSALKLVVLPLIVYLVIRPQAEIAKTAIIQLAMPAAITPFALADEFNLKKDFICNAIIFSTLLSIFTLPIFIYLLAL